MADLNSSDRYEILAELYRRQFGELAPGKDRSPLADIQSNEERIANNERWSEWLTHKFNHPLERALEKIHCMQRQAEQREESLVIVGDAANEHLSRCDALAAENQRLRAELEIRWQDLPGATEELVASAPEGMRPLMRQWISEFERLRADGEILDWLDSECADLRCEVDQYQDDADTHYEVVTCHMAKPNQRVVGAGKDVRAAIRAAMRGESNSDQVEQASDICEDCPPFGYPTDKTRCADCPRRPK